MSKHYVTALKGDRGHAPYRITYLSGDIENELKLLGQALTWRQIEEESKVIIYDITAETPTVGVVVKKFTSTEPHSSSSELRCINKITIEFLKNGLRSQRTYEATDIGLEPLTGDTLCKDKRTFLHHHP